MTRLFSKIAQWVARKLGTPTAFICAVISILAWAVTGPVFGFSDTWQLVINTSTTIVSYLMVFLIQATQNRDIAALHVKLDELLRVNKEARNTLLSIEDKTEDEILEMKSSMPHA